MSLSTLPFMTTGLAIAVRVLSSHARKAVSPFCFDAAFFVFLRPLTMSAALPSVIASNTSSFAFAWRWSRQTMRSPSVRKAISRRRRHKVSKSKWRWEKMSAEGRKVIFVPLSLCGKPLPLDSEVELRSLSGSKLLPSLKDMQNLRPPRHTVRSSDCESALTTETPTPCKPPDTL